MKYRFPAILMLCLLFAPAAAFGQDALTIVDDKIGIGTGTPEVAVHVLRDPATATNMTLFKLENKGAGRFDIENTETGVLWFVQNDQDGTYKISREGSGGAELILRRRLDADGATLTVDGSLQATNVTFTSARESKTDFSPVDTQELLARLAALPIEQWRYRHEETGVRHVGPMAEEFRQAFGVGGPEGTISVADAAGVALAAVQGLNGLLEESRQEMAELRAEVEALRQEREEMAARLDALEAEPN